ncbi:MAG: hypothetical protein LBK29_03870 [Oscillospiraceae bacterium]|jgi:hypothetical protein|nr:hypothetical protein [Oscillospiraceae bacterium]
MPKNFLLPGINDIASVLNEFLREEAIPISSDEQLERAKYKNFKKVIMYLNRAILEAKNVFSKKTFQQKLMIGKIKSAYYYIVEKRTSSSRVKQSLCFLVDQYFSSVNEYIRSILILLSSTSTFIFNVAQEFLKENKKNSNEQKDTRIASDLAKIIMKTNDIKGNLNDMYSKSESFKFSDKDSEEFNQAEVIAEKRQNCENFKERVIIPFESVEKDFKKYALEIKKITQDYSKRLSSTPKTKSIGRLIFRTTVRTNRFIRLALVLLPKFTDLAYLALKQIGKSEDIPEILQTDDTNLGFFGIDKEADLGIEIPEDESPEKTRKKHHKFLFDALFPNGRPISSDVAQNQIGDCWLLTVLQTLADSHPDEIIKCFLNLYNKDGTRVHFRFGEELKLRLYEVKGDYLKGYKPSQPRIISVSLARVLVGNLGLALWPQIFEKAFTAMIGINPMVRKLLSKFTPFSLQKGTDTALGGEVSLKNEIENDTSNYTSFAYVTITGRPSVPFGKLKDSTTISNLEKDIKQGKLLNCSCHTEREVENYDMNGRKLPKKATLYAPHAYRIIDIFEAGGKKFIIIGNPWGGQKLSDKGNIILDFNDFKNNLTVRKFEDINKGIPESLVQTQVTLMRANDENTEIKLIELKKGTKAKQLEKIINEKFGLNPNTALIFAEYDESFKLIAKTQKQKDKIETKGRKTFILRSGVYNGSKRLEVIEDYIIIRVENKSGHARFPFVRTCLVSECYKYASTKLNLDEALVNSFSAVATVKHKPVSSFKDGILSPGSDPALGEIFSEYIDLSKTLTISISEELLSQTTGLKLSKSAPREQTDGFESSGTSPEKIEVKFDFFGEVKSISIRKGTQFQEIGKRVSKLFNIEGEKFYFMKNPYAEFNPWETITEKNAKKNIIIKADIRKQIEVHFVYKYPEKPQKYESAVISLKFGSTPEEAAIAGLKCVNFCMEEGYGNFKSDELEMFYCLKDGGIIPIESVDIYKGLQDEIRVFVKQKPKIIRFYLICELFNINLKKIVYEETIEVRDKLAVNVLEKFVQDTAKKEKIENFKPIWKFKELKITCNSYKEIEEKILRRANDTEDPPLKANLIFKVAAKIELSMVSGEKFSKQLEMKIGSECNQSFILEAFNSNLLPSDFLFFEISSSGKKVDYNQIYHGGLILVQENYVTLKIKGREGQIKFPQNKTLLDCYKAISDALGIQTDEDLSGVSASVKAEGKVLRKIYDFERYVTSVFYGINSKTEKTIEFELPLIYFKFGDEIKTFEIEKPEILGNIKSDVLKMFNLTGENFGFFNSYKKRYSEDTVLDFKSSREGEPIVILSLLYFKFGNETKAFGIKKGKTLESVKYNIFIAFGIDYRHCLSFFNSIGEKYSENVVLNLESNNEENPIIILNSIYFKFGDEIKIFGAKITETLGDIKSDVLKMFNLTGENFGFFDSYKKRYSEDTVESSREQNPIVILDLVYFKFENETKAFGIKKGETLESVKYNIFTAFGIDYRYYLSFFNSLGEKYSENTVLNFESGNKENPIIILNSMYFKFGDEIKIFEAKITETLGDIKSDVLKMFGLTGGNFGFFDSYKKRYSENTVESSREGEPIAILGLAYFKFESEIKAFGIKKNETLMHVKHYVFKMFDINIFNSFLGFFDSKGEKYNENVVLNLESNNEKNPITILKFLLFKFEDETKTLGVEKKIETLKDIRNSALKMFNLTDGKLGFFNKNREKYSEDAILDFKSSGEGEPIVILNLVYFKFENETKVIGIKKNVILRSIKNNALKMFGLTDGEFGFFNQKREKYSEDIILDFELNSEKNPIVILDLAYFKFEREIKAFGIKKNETLRNIKDSVLKMFDLTDGRFEFFIPYKGKCNEDTFLNFELKSKEKPIVIKNKELYLVYFKFGDKIKTVEIKKAETLKDLKSGVLKIFGLNDERFDFFETYNDKRYSEDTILDFELSSEEYPIVVKMPEDEKLKFTIFYNEKLFNMELESNLSSYIDVSYLKFKISEILFPDSFYRPHIENFLANADFYWLRNGKRFPFSKEQRIIYGKYTEIEIIFRFNLKASFLSEVEKNFEILGTGDEKEILPWLKSYRTEIKKKYKIPDWIEFFVKIGRVYTELDSQSNESNERIFKLIYDSISSFQKEIYIDLTFGFEFEFEKGHSNELIKDTLCNEFIAGYNDLFLIIDVSEFNVLKFKECHLKYCIKNYDKKQIKIKEKKGGKELEDSFKLFDLEKPPYVSF